MAFHPIDETAHVNSPKLSKEDRSEFNDLVLYKINPNTDPKVSEFLNKYKDLHYYFGYVTFIIKLLNTDPSKLTVEEQNMCKEAIAIIYS